MNYNLNFKNKKILITGAANGIGLESAVAFLQNGAEVFMADYNEKALLERANPLKNTLKVLYIPLLLTSQKVKMYRKWLKKSKCTLKSLMCL